MPDHDKSLKNLTGKWKMSKPLSSDITPVLTIQAFNPLMKKAIQHAPVTLTITQPSAHEIHIEQSTSASIPGIKEEWYPPPASSSSTDQQGEWRENKDALMGRVRSRSRWARVGELEEAGLGGEAGFLLEGLRGDRETVVAEVEGMEGEGWRAVQVWSMDGEGRFVRRVVTKGEGKRAGERAETVLVYEFEG